MGSVAPLEIVFQEQSYSSLHSRQSLAWDHFRGDINNPCGNTADPCGVIADPCGVIADPCGVIVIPVALSRSLRRCRSLRDSLNIVKHHKTHTKTSCYIVIHHKTSWTTSKTSWTINETSWNTFKTLWNIMKHSPFDVTISAIDLEMDVAI